jgi:hypothetical protein
LKPAEFNPIALVICSGGTISLTNACRAGTSNALADPNRNASRYTCHVCTAPVTAKMPRAAAVRPREYRSARTPAKADSSKVGRNCRPVVMPNAPALPVSTSTSQSCATRCIQVPVFEMSEPMAKSR